MFGDGHPTSQEVAPLAGGIEPLVRLSGAAAGVTGIVSATRRDLIYWRPAAGVGFSAAKESAAPRKFSALQRL